MADLELELYFYPECGFSKSVLNTIQNLSVADRITMKDIRLNLEYEKELIVLCGDPTVPTLKVNGEVLREAEAIKRFLVDQFLD